ncbi:Uncharacterised protein [Serratia ficaria]|nr:Uncharacterised protein [Serratia ficaria]VVA48432.1 hypothetical protein SERVES_02167 [Serratia ficaria]
MALLPPLAFTDITPFCARRCLLKTKSPQRRPSKTLTSTNSTPSWRSTGAISPAAFGRFHRVTNWPCLVGVVLATRNITRFPCSSNRQAPYSPLSASRSGSVGYIPAGKINALIAYASCSGICPAAGSANPAVPVSDIRFSIPPPRVNMRYPRQRAFRYCTACCVCGWSRNASRNRRVPPISGSASFRSNCLLISGPRPAASGAGVFSATG